MPLKTYTVAYIEPDIDLCQFFVCQAEEQCRDSEPVAELLYTHEGRLALIPDAQLSQLEQEVAP